MQRRRRDTVAGEKEGAKFGKEVETKGSKNNGSKVDHTFLSECYFICLAIADRPHSILLCAQMPPGHQPEAHCSFVGRYDVLNIYPCLPSVIR